MKTKMKERILISFIYALGIFLLVPPLFAEGRVFDVTIGEARSVYFCNVYFSVLYAIFAWVGLSVPILLNINKYPIFSNISFAFSSWCLAKLSFEVANLNHPLEVFNNGSSKMVFNTFLISSLVFITLLIIKYQWNRRHQ